MKPQDLLDLYSDYLISSFGATTATGLSHLLEAMSAMIKSPAFSPAPNEPPPSCGTSSSRTCDRCKAKRVC